MLYLQAGNDSLLDCMQCNFSNSSGKHGGKHAFFSGNIQKNNRIAHRCTRFC